MDEKKAMIIAPHPDDEINLAGQILPYLHECDYKVYVVYTTNGDSNKTIGNKRLNEALMSCKILGISTDNIIFLGYANEWEHEKHLYNESKNSLVSAIGKNQTNSINAHPEYCFKKNGRHHKFTKANFKTDMKTVICDYFPGLIICVDFDSHPDHRAASLMFDEVIGEILKEQQVYRPVILKKFAYNGVWKGDKDYYPYPCAKTKMHTGISYSGLIHDLESPTYKWADRVVIPSHKKTITPLLTKNILYKAAKQHRCTVAWYEMQRVINGDSIFWERRTDNLLLSKVTINTSSGDAIYINDFKTFDVDDITNNELICKDKEYCWRPTKDDDLKELRIAFNIEISIQNINIYEDFSNENHIKRMKVIVGEHIFFVEPNRDGSKTNLYLKNKVLTKIIEFKILEYEGEPGISEIEVFDRVEKKLDFIACVDRGKVNIRVYEYFLQKLEKLFFTIKFLFAFKIKYELNGFWSRISK